jgi:hypothetical protein
MRIFRHRAPERRRDRRKCRIGSKCAWVTLATSERGCAFGVHLYKLAVREGGLGGAKEDGGLVVAVMDVVRGKVDLVEGAAAHLRGD